MKLPFAIGAVLCGAAALAPAEIMQRFESVKARDGAGGRFVFRNSPETGRYFEYPIAVYRIEGNRHVVVQE